MGKSVSAMLICLFVLIREIGGKKSFPSGKKQKYFITFAALSQAAGMVPG
jgi:hypothetical protein